MIAIHSALYIFKPNSAGDEGGLYPYRKFAYGAYVFLPILLASLAFVNPEDAYVSDGTYCYLPVRPVWYRLTLSWIPRYLIFMIILGIYASIYFYVRYKFRGFAEQQSLPSDQSTTIERQRTDSLPQEVHTPQLQVHGLIPVSRQTTSHEDKEEISKPPPTEMRRNSSFARPAELQRHGSFVRRGSVHQFMILASFTNKIEPALSTPTSDLSITASNSSLEVERPIPDSVIHRLPSAVLGGPTTTTDLTPVTENEQTTSRRDPSIIPQDPQTQPAASHEATIPLQSTFPSQRRRTLSGSGTAPLSRLYLTNSRGDNLTDIDMLRTRDKIRRQLRFLFIYPLVYIGMWIVPFISHILQYQSRYAHEPPFVLSCLTVLCVTMQAAVDCWLFSTREKPWRHIPDTQGGFWESLKFWTGWHGVAERKIVKGPGRTREEMVKEARSAYKRRDAELAQRRTIVEEEAAVAAKKKRDSGVETPRKKGERSWWEDGRSSLDRTTEEV